MRTSFNFFFGSLLVAGVFSAEAQVYWQGPSGTAADWFEPSNWTGGVVPVGVGVQITNGGIAEVSSGTVSNCTVDAGRAAGPGMLRVSAGEMTNCTLRAGYDGSGGKIEISGGVVSTPSWFGLRAGGVAGSTGEVVMTGGTLSPTSYLIGDWGTGSFALSNGTVTATYWQTFIGNNAGSDGTFVQSGGTNNYNGLACYIGYGAGSSGRYILNGGTLNGSSGGIVVGVYGTGYMEMNGGTLNVPGTVYVGSNIGSDGTLVLNNFTNTFTNLQIGPAWPYKGAKGTCIMNGGNITNMGGGAIGSASNCVSTFIQNGGRLKRGALTLPASDGATGTFILSNNAAMTCGGDITIKAGGRLEIRGADVSGGGVYMNGSDSYAEMTAGSLTVAGRFLVPNGTNAAAFYMRGGNLFRTYVANQSARATGQCNT